MAKPLAIRQGESTRRNPQIGYRLSETLKLTYPSSASGLHLPSLRCCTKIGLWLIGLSLGGMFVHMCIRYWAVAIVTFLIVIAILVLIYFLDDYAPRRDSQVANSPTKPHEHIISSGC